MASAQGLWSGWRHDRDYCCIARPIGRAWIETSDRVLVSVQANGIARPIGRAWIETISIGCGRVQPYASPGQLAGRGLKRIGDCCRER